MGLKRCISSAYLPGCKDKVWQQREYGVLNGYEINHDEEWPRSLILHLYRRGREKLAALFSLDLLSAIENLWLSTFRSDVWFPDQGIYRLTPGKGGRDAI